MNYRGQFILCKKAIGILNAFDDKTISRVLTILFRECAGECIEVEKESQTVQIALKLVGERQPTTTDGNERNPPLSPSEKETKEKNQKKGEEKIHSPSRSISIIPQLFERFWEAYPRKVGKAAAEKSFAKCVGKDRETQQAILDQMLKALEWQKRTDQWQEAEFIPHPATWLNQHRWEDETAIDPIEAAAQAREDACAESNRQMAEIAKRFAAPEERV